MVDQTGEDIDEHWTLRASDRALLGNKTGTTRLGFAVLLKMFQAEGRFPSRPEEVPIAAVEAIARQIGVPAAAWRSYGSGPRCPFLSDAWRHEVAARTGTTARARSRARPMPWGRVCGRSGQLP